MAGDSVHQASRLVQFDHAVTMTYPGSPSGEVQLYRPAVELCIQFLFPKISPPPIVIASGHGNADTGLPDAREGGQRGENSSRDHGPICEPEFEEVTINEEVIPKVWHRLEKSVKGGAGLAGIFAQMGIRDNDSCR